MVVAILVYRDMLALHCDHCAISNHSAAICHGMSPALKSTARRVTLGQNLGRKGFTDVIKTIFYLRDLVLSYAKEIVSISSAV